MASEVPPPPVPLMTSAINYPTFFADGVWFASNIGNTIRVTFLESILEPQNSPQPGMKSRHVGTLVMPREGFNSMVEYLNNMKVYFDHLDATNAAE